MNSVEQDNLVLMKVKKVRTARIAYKLPTQPIFACPKGLVYA